MSEQVQGQPARLETYVDRTLVAGGESSQRFALLLLHAPDAAGGAVHPPLNLSLVIDRSGSMSGAKLEYAREAASHALRLLHTTDRIAIVIYDDEVTVLAPSAVVTPQHRDALLRQLRTVHSGGQTDLYGGWEAGCRQVAAGQGPEFINRVLLLTDGLANVGNRDQESIVAGVKAQRRADITTTTFGVGADFNQFLLQGMADNGGGHFYFIDQPSQIPALFASELGEMLTVTARNLELTLQAPAGVQVDLLNDLPLRAGAGGLTVEVGDACAGEVRVLAFRLGLPPAALHSEVRLPLTIRYVDAAGQPVTVAAAGFTFLVKPGAACDEQPVNELVLAEAGRLLGERAKLQALAKLHAGETGAARAILAEAVALVERLLPAELAIPIVRELQGVLAQADELRMDPGAAKRAHYTAYQSQRGRGPK